MGRSSCGVTAMRQRHGGGPMRAEGEPQLQRSGARSRAARPEHAAQQSSLPTGEADPDAAASGRAIAGRGSQTPRQYWPRSWSGTRPDQHPLDPFSVERDQGPSKEDAFSRADREAARCGEAHGCPMVCWGRSTPRSSKSGDPSRPPGAVRTGPRSSPQRPGMRSWSASTSAGMPCRRSASGTG